METDNYIKVIKNYRKVNHISQEKFAEIVGYDKSHISRIENGSREPSVDFLIHFSLESGLSIDYILGLETEAGVQLIINEYTKRIMKLAPKDRQLIFNIAEPLITRLEKDSNR